MTIWEATCWFVFIIGLVAYVSSRYHMKTVKRDLDQMQKILDKRQFNRVMNYRKEQL